MSNYPKAKVSCLKPLTVTFCIAGTYPDGDLPNRHCTPDDDGCAADLKEWLEDQGVMFQSENTTDFVLITTALVNEAKISTWLSLNGVKI